MDRWRKAAAALCHILFLLPAAVAALLFALLPRHPEFTETVIARVLFRAVAVPLGFLTSLVSFSLTELCAALALPSLIVLAALLIHRLLRSGCRARTLARAGKAVGWFLSVALLFYTMLHGLNFYRLPLSDLMDLDTSPKSPAYLQAVCMDLARRASTERDALSTDENGLTVLSQSVGDTLRMAGEGYRPLTEEYPFLFGTVWRAKPVRLSHWWSYTGITGMYFPFFAEANVNIDQPPLDIPSTAAHELAHTRGFAREDECNFLAALSCFSHPSADYRYSGYLMAYIYCANALYAYDQEMWAETQEACSDGMKADMRERNRYWKQFEGKVQETSTSINNSFIEIQGDDDGVLSYDRVVELLLAFYEKEGWVPADGA